MRFMILVKATNESETGVMPSEQSFTEMGIFNEEPVNAGILLDGGWASPQFKRGPCQVLRK